MVLPTVSWALLHQIAIHMSLQTCPQASVDGGNSSVKVSLFPGVPHFGKEISYHRIHLNHLLHLKVTAVRKIKRYIQDFMTTQGSQRCFKFNYWGSNHPELCHPGYTGKSFHDLCHGFLVWSLKNILSGNGEDGSRNHKTKFNVVFRSRGLLTSSVVV